MNLNEVIDRNSCPKFKVPCVVKALLCLIIFSIPISLSAQFDEVEFKKIFIEIDGEEVYNIELITQDGQGYIWMTTNLGLVRYDGLEGKLYYDRKSEFSNDFIGALYVDYLGDLWVGTNTGPSKYDPVCDCFNQYPTHIDDISLNEIRSITEDKNKNIWFGTKSGNLFLYEREKDTFTKMPLNASDSMAIAIDGIYHLLVDQNNHLWIGTYKGLFRYNISSGMVSQYLNDPQEVHSLSDNRISALYEDQQGQLLIGTYNSGFHIYNPENELLTRQSFDVNNHSPIYAPYSEDKVYGDDPHVAIIHQDQKGGYWIGTTGKGINYINPKTKTFENYHFDLVNPQVLSAFLEDRNGNIWIGGIMGGGLFRADLFALKYHVNTKIPNVEAVYESPLSPGILWVSSQEYGLRKINLETNKTKSYIPDKDNSKSIGHTWVRSVYQENVRTLWAGLGHGGPYGYQIGDGGITRMDIESETFTNFKLLREDDGRDDFSYTVYSICEDKEGYLWLGTGPGGIFRSDREKKEFEHFKIIKNDSLSRDVFLNIVRLDTNGDIWASDFAGDGTLYLYDRQKDQFDAYLKGFKMYNLIIDEKGRYLIGTWEKGLIHLNPADKTYIQYTKKEGLPSNEVVDIAKGKNGIYWFNTRLGPAKFDAKNNKISSVGLPKFRYNRGIIKASDSQIYLSANIGLPSFYPSQIEGNPYPPQLVISDLLISDTNFSLEENRSNEIKLTHDQNDITFKYVGLHFSDPEKNSYKYKLGPMDKEWINASNQRSVRFANLSPGTYNFQVTASNSDGVWSEETATVQFTITPPWWATWWAYLVYISLFAFLANRIYQFQLSRRMVASESKRLKEINEFKNTLFTNITHEFRTPLTVIKGMTDSIKSNLENNKMDGLENSLEMIDRNSDGLLHLVNEMLDLAKIESGNLELHLVQADVIPFIKYVGESFSSFAEENQISLTIYAETDTLLMDFDEDKLTAIISNLLSNAIKFTPQYGKIIVHIHQISENEKEYLFIKIIDNGIGISQAELPHIFNRFFQADASTIRKRGGTGIGLALTKELVELMQGSIEVKSKIGEGSTFSIMIPVSRNAPLSESIQIGKISPAPIGKAPLPAEPIPSQHSENPLCLIIEDNIDVAHYLKTCLQDKYETIHASNGIDGIEMALEKVPDIIISDVMMPGKDGFEVCATLKSDERSDHIPIVLLTAKATVEDRLAGLSHGADAYLNKPFNKEELFIRLDQLVATRKKLIHKIQKEGFTTLLKKGTDNPKLQFLQKAKELIHDDIGNAEFGSGDLARKLLISESQLYRKLKAITGKSTAVFIRSIRLQYARELLTVTDKTISEVAYEVGFNDPSWFSRVYKEEFGYSPSETPK